jgi:sec-independent protein translocase protein TatA
VNVGPFQILIIALVFLVLFGRGRISEMMGDFGKGVKSFRSSMTDDDEPARPAPPVRLEAPGREASPESETAADLKPAPDQSHS